MLKIQLYVLAFFFFFNDTATTEIYTLSLHDALPISWSSKSIDGFTSSEIRVRAGEMSDEALSRSEEHTSELQSQSNLVCRLLLEKKKNTHTTKRNFPAILYSLERRTVLHS